MEAALESWREVGSRRHASNSKDHSNSWYSRNGAATTKTTATTGTYGMGQQQQRPQQQLVLMERGSNNKDHRLVLETWRLVLWP
jgi:hypothetical protein